MVMGLPVGSGNLATLKEFCGRRSFSVLLIAISVILVYINTLDVPFIFDDNDYIVDNPVIKEFSNLTGKTPQSSLSVPDLVSQTRDTRFLGYLSFYLNYRLNGLEVYGYHVFNIAVHLANSLLVFVLVLLTLETPAMRGSALRGYDHYISLFASLLFAVHPVQTQAVTYISQRFTSLSVLFFLSSLVLYILSRDQSRGSGKFVLYVISLVLALSSMRTKEIAFTLPVIIVLYEIIFLSGSSRKRALLLAPFILLIFTIPLAVLDPGKPLGIAVDEATRTQTVISRHDYFLTQPRVIITYLRLLFVPVNQTLDYDYSIYDSIFAPEAILSFLALISIILVGVHLVIRSQGRDPGRRFMGFGILWFFITLSVESSFISLRDVINEHRLYLPSVGAFVLIASGASYALPLLKNRRMAGRPALLGAVVLVFALGIAAFERNSVWRDEVVFFEDMVSKSPLKARPHILLGAAYEEKGRFEDAYEEYVYALRLKPDYSKPHSAMGADYESAEEYEDAIRREIETRAGYHMDAAMYAAALESDPQNAGLLNKMGMALEKLGRLYEAEKALKRAVNLNPSDAEAQNNLGILYYYQGVFSKAMDHYERAVDSDPGLAEAYNNLGVVHFKLGIHDKAIEQYRIALSLRPDYEDALQNLKMAESAMLLKNERGIKK